MDEIRCSIELREDENRLSPGRLVGVLMSYGKQAKDRKEVFDFGSLKWDPTGIVVNRQHLRSAPIARILPTVEGNDVKINAPLPDTSAGRDAAAEIRSGLMKGMSIEFKAVRQSIVGGVRRITEAVFSPVLRLLTDPSYAAGSSVEVQGEKGGGNRPDASTLWL